MRYRSTNPSTSQIHRRRSSTDLDLLARTRHVASKNRDVQVVHSVRKVSGCTATTTSSPMSRKRTKKVQRHLPTTMATAANSDASYVNVSIENDSPDGQAQGQYERNLSILNKCIHILGSNALDLAKDLPKMVVIGEESIGKSSLLECLTDVPFPQASGTCTRCPTTVQCTRTAHGTNATYEIQRGGKYEVCMLRETHKNRGVCTACTV